MGKINGSHRGGSVTPLCTIFCFVLLQMLKQTGEFNKTNLVDL